MQANSATKCTNCLRRRAAPFSFNEWRRANNGNPILHLNEATSRIGATRSRSCLRRGAVISVGDMIHGRAAYQLSPLSRKIWAALEEFPAAIPDAYRPGRFDTEPPSLFWPNFPIAFTENAASPFVKRKRRGVPGEGR